MLKDITQDRGADQETTKVSPHQAITMISLDLKEDITIRMPMVEGTCQGQPIQGRLNKRLSILPYRCFIVICYKYLFTSTQTSGDGASSSELALVAQLEPGLVAGGMLGAL